jgi:hypothetical protein
MISTKSIIAGIESVPAEWVFEHYLNIGEKLTGQDVKIHSVFKTEKTPSMFIYFKGDSDEYKFKDFSSGKQGSKVKLVEELFNLSYGQAVNKICQDYERFLKDHDYKHVDEYKIQNKYRVVDFEIRHWTNVDAKFWTKFKINSKILDKYNVSGLSYFTMAKEGEPNSDIVFKGNYMYGYFREDGSLYKIYLPHNPNKKFIKVQNYIQGMDQLCYDKEFLIITSSLKDLMAFVKLGYRNAEVIAPDSENTMIAEQYIKSLKKKYSKLCVLFDNDEAGVNAAIKYQERYDIPYVVLDMSKDLSDSVRDFGIQKVKERLHGLLSNVLKE